ncbi:type IV secretory system conjugative DNA transfer family protein [Phaeobacter sp. JH20_10]|uniref:type IV secretory system conjugative DNA transfer family protein n=1 Tax=Phaeobacter sp. JH20_10 TaxID=3112469 RepID=UPI003A84C013
MAQIVPQIIEIAIPVVQIVVVAKGVSTVIRWTVIATLKKFGAWDPRWDRRIPRLLPWRMFWRGYIAYKEWREEYFGLGEENAALAGSLTQLSKQYDDDDSLMGKVRLPYALPCPVLSSEEIETSKLIIGPAGTGKSVTEQTQLGLISDRGTCALYDPKGQHTHNILYALADRGHKLVVIDPLNSLPRATGKLELFANVRELNRRMGGDFTTILLDKFAAAIFPDDGSNNKFFVLTPRQLWARLMKFTMSLGPTTTILDARRFLTHGFIEDADGDVQLAMVMLWTAMARGKDEYVSAAGIAMLEVDPKTRSNILETTRTNTSFWSHDQTMEVSDDNHAYISDLKPEPGNDDGLIISFVIPVGLANTTYKPYLAQWFSLILFMFEAIPGTITPKCRLVIEELQSFAGSIDGIETVAPLLRGYGCSFTGITQDYSGLCGAIGQNNAESMIGSSSHVQFVGTNDVPSRDLIQKLSLGKKTVRKRKWGFLWTTEKRHKPVLTDDQLRRVLSPKRKQILVHRAGQRAMLLRQAPGYQELPVWLCYADRDFGESAPRAWFRSIWERYNQQPDTAAQDSSSEEPDELIPEPPQEPQCTPTYALSREDAQALFGLSEPYSNKEVSARAACLNGNFPPALITAAMKQLEV